VREPVDVVSLGAGLGLIAVGGLLLLDQAGSLELTIGLAAALMAALIGMILLLSGLSDDER
jgi:hypothetical protein